jgi:hypothetical protein
MGCCPDAVSLGVECCPDEGSRRCQNLQPVWMLQARMLLRRVPKPQVPESALAPLRPVTDATMLLDARHAEQQERPGRPMLVPRLLA